ncbi:CbrC family protein [Pseudomonas sp. 13B_2.1_Bac1]|uniref:CbrC family protein n=1 Tax=Pseudomonas sp. 13B_2.1_Bac1 TaxID=2971624 RepID=UPI0021C97680|nr:CbrC family protein [Pseudomonas sp. 13B_2.1_Bac1]MCU1782181.1 CbrC family protein [Pseudomonas sp. 13B_2.1_Bac1]
MTLPQFTYHHDPVGSGSVQPSSTVCVCCNQTRGYIYVGPVYAIEEYEACICPWCIADGSAHERLGATFVDEDSIGLDGDAGLSDAQVAEVSQRTPGFSGWQQEAWFTHCNDAGQFIGKAGRAELLALGAEAIAAVQDATGLEDGPQWQAFFEALEKDHGPTAYLFRCRHCATLGAYQDCH